jgi:hypothetical protein
MKMIIRKSNLRWGAGRLLIAAAASLFGGSAYAQAPWADAHQGPSWRPQPLVEPEGPVFSWQPPRFAVAAESRTTWVQDSAARRLVGKRAPTGGGLSLQADAWRPSDKLVAKVDLGWALTSTTDQQPASSEIESLDTHLLSLGVSARYHLFRWLAPYARLAGGMGWDKLTVGSGAGQLHDKHTFGHASVGGGIYLRSPSLQLRASRPSLALGLIGNLEAGYMLATSSTFSLQSSPAAGAKDAIPTQPVVIGEVGRNAPYLRLSFGLAF